MYELESIVTEYWPLKYTLYPSALGTGAQEMVFPFLDITGAAGLAARAVAKTPADSKIAARGHRDIFILQLESMLNLLVERVTVTQICPRRCRASVLRLLTPSSMRYARDFALAGGTFVSRYLSGLLTTTYVLQLQ